MILIVGGIASGKKTYAEQNGLLEGVVFDARAAEASLVALEEATVVLHVEELVRLGELPEGAFEALQGKVVITYTEVGSGVIPLTWEDRQFRERAGALGARLAAEAQRVVRMVCGIPVELKG